jgi:hypothetical protein
MAYNPIAVFTRSTLASLKSLISYPQEVQTQCRATTGDGGGGTFTFRTGDQSANVTADAREGLWVAPNSDPTGASGAWQRIYNDRIQAEWFGLTYGLAGDNTTALQAAIDAAAALQTQLQLPAGTLQCTGQLTLPSFTTTGNAWDEYNPFVMIGMGVNQTILKYTGATGSYAIAHATIGGTTNRSQNYGVELRDFTLIGPQDYSNAAHGIGIDNTRRPLIRNVRFQGFPGGVGIHLYGQTKGGIFGAQIKDCYFGNNQFQTSGGEVLYSLDTMAEWALRYALWLDGPYNTTGKVNDINFSTSTVYEMLIGGVLIEGHGVWDPLTSVGSSANFISSQNVFFFQSARKIEEGVLSSVTSTTIMALRLTNFLYDTNGDFDGFYLGTQNNLGRWQRKYITNFGGAAREVTVAGAFDVAPYYQTATAQAGSTTSVTLAAGASAVNDFYNFGRVTILSGTGAGQTATITGYTGSSKVALAEFVVAPDNTSVYEVSTRYRIGYADAAAQAAFPNPDALQHCFRWASGYSMQSTGDYSEEALFLTANQYANTDVAIVAPEDVVNDNIFCMRDDGSYFAPRLFVGVKPRGSDQTPAQIISGPILVINAEFENEPSGVILRHMLNATSAAVKNGDVVRYSSTSAIECLDSAIYTGSAGNYVHGVVYNSQARVSQIGEYCTVAVSGQNIKVNVTGTIEIGDPIVSSTSALAVALPPLPISVNGTAQAGAATTITLAAAATAVDEYYTGAQISITGGTGVGQINTITAYVGSTKVATTLQWATTPDATSTYRLVMFAQSFMHRALGRCLVASADAGVKLVRCTIKGW